jgi:hypothetical protein
MPEERLDFIAAHALSDDPQKGFTARFFQHAPPKLRLWIQPGKNGTPFLTGKIIGGAFSSTILESLKRRLTGSSDNNAIPTGIDLEPGDVLMLPTRGDNPDEVEFHGFGRTRQSYVELAARHAGTKSVDGYETLIGWVRPYTITGQPV